MQPFVVYQDNHILFSSSAEKEIGPAIRLCSTDSRLFLIDTAHRLLTGAVTASHEIEFILLKEDIVDVDLFNSTLYIVTGRGQVFQQDISDFNITNEWNEIVVHEADGSTRVPIVRVKCNLIGTVMITADRELYGFGNFVSILNSEFPIKFECFSGLKVCDISAGEDFFIVLTFKEGKGKFDIEDDDISSCSSSSVTKCDKSKLNDSTNSKTVKRTDTEEEELQDDEACSEYEAESVISFGCKQVSSNDIPANIRYLIQKGCNLVTTNIWSFGRCNNGRLGTGDHIKRLGLNTVLNLNGIGVCSISSGKEHTLARTLDGRIFQWGSNERKQIDSRLEADNVSAPKQIPVVQNGHKSNHVIEAECSDFKSFFLKNDLTLIEFCKQTINRELILKDNSDKGFPIFLCTRNFLLQNHKVFVTEIQESLEASQLMMRECIDSLKNIKFLQKNVTYKLNFVSEYDKLCHGYTNVVYMLALHLQSIDRLYRNDINFYELICLKNAKELKEIFGVYVNVFCNIKALNGFDDMTKICENSKSKLNIPKLEQMFNQPFNEIENIVNLIEKLIVLYSDSDYPLDKYLQDWKNFTLFYQKELDLASVTATFWNEHGRYSEIRLLKEPHRRIVLDSWKFPIKLQNVKKFSSYYFILFTDVFCYFGSQMEIHPLKTVWLQNEGEFSFKIITPEKSFVLLSHIHKRKWLSELERCVNVVLGRYLDEKVCRARSAAYHYSANHTVYPKVHCFGRWEVGVMHGICHLEFPDGKIYYGEMVKGRIEGHGQMLIPSLGMYEGSFKAGKYNGYGVYEMKNNEVYEGYFRAGVFHGHGVLRNNFSTYVGEFVNNSKCGYGILDDTVTGDKHIGMFAENERTGPGISVTMNGDYFEGMFLNDRLNGEGIAVLQNGCFYEGELTMTGPRGKGCYYLSQKDVENTRRSFSNDDQSDGYVLGNVITGNLDGNWTDVKVINGSVSLNRTYRKYPESIGNLIVDNRRKWRSLFDNWEEQVFGDTVFNEVKFVWDKIAIFITSQKKQDKAKAIESTTSKHFFLKNLLLHSNYADPKLQNSMSLDKISLRSVNTTYSKRSTLELNVKRKSYSNETLFDSRSFFERNPVSFDQKIFSSFSSLRIFDENSSLLNKSFEDPYSDNNYDTNMKSLDFTPSFGMDILTEQDLQSIQEYLSQAFKDPHHPLCLLNQKITNCFYTSYGCWKIKPPQIISKQAMAEWDSITLRIYEIVKRMFPALSQPNGVKVSHASLLYPIVSAEGIYSTLFVLYANKHSQRDEIYRQRVMQASRKSDEELAEILGLQSEISSIVMDELFKKAISTLKQIAEKYCRSEMLRIIEKSYQQIDAARINSLDKSVIFTTDNIMPLSIFLVLRAGVPHLGAELALLEDLFGVEFESETSGFAGYCLTNIQASYKYIICGQLFKD